MNSNYSYKRSKFRPKEALMMAGGKEVHYAEEKGKKLRVQFSERVEHTWISFQLPLDQVIWER